MTHLQWTINSTGFSNPSNRSEHAGWETYYITSLKRHRKQNLSSQTAELEALQARLRETEQRLSEKQSALPSSTNRTTGGTNSPHRRQPLGDTFDSRDGGQSSQNAASPLSNTSRSETGSVLPSTMSRWKPDPQDTTTAGQPNARDISAEQLSGQRGNRIT